MKTLNLLVLRCKELEKCRAFYEMIGMQFQQHRHGNGPEHYAHEDERGVFELYPAGEGGPDSTGLGFAVADLPAFRDRCVTAGASPAEIRTNPWGKSFVVRDPDGRRVEITETKG